MIPTNALPLSLIIALVFGCINHQMECQPTPPLDEMDPQTQGDDNDADPPSSSFSSSSRSSSTLSANNNTSMTEAEVEAEVDTDEEPTEEEQEQQETTYHAKQNFNSTMGGKDLQVLFAMAVGCNSRDLPNHKDPLFCKAKAYHSEVKPDAATLKLEVTRRWNAYIHKGRQPCLSNWKINKCLKYLMSHPIPTLEKRDLDFLASELDEWKEYNNSSMTVMREKKTGLFTIPGHPIYPF